MGKASPGLGQWLQERCCQEHLSLRQAAAKSGLSHATIDGVINGTSPSPETVRKLARAFGNGQRENLALEDELLQLAGYRTPRAEPDGTNMALAQLMDRLTQFSQSQLRMIVSFADFLAGMEYK